VGEGLNMKQHIFVLNRWKGRSKYYYII